MRLVGSALALLLTFALACSGAGAAGEHGKDLVEVEVDGRTRSAWVHAPPRWSPDGRWPLILMFHGGTGSNGMNVVDLWKSQAEGRYVLAFPNGQVDRPTEPGWGNADPEEVARDQRFVRALLAALVERYAIDPARIFVAGHSNGANMVLTLACDMPESFAGFAAVNQLQRASVAERCAPERARPMWIALGTADGKARWEGHAGALSGEQTLDFWRRAGGCGPDPAVSWSDAPGDDTRTERRVYKDCTRARVEAVVVHGGGHAWPGSGHRDSTRDVSATDEIVRFFDSL